MMTPEDRDRLRLLLAAMGAVVDADMREVNRAAGVADSRFALVVQVLGETIVVTNVDSVAKLGFLLGKGADVDGAHVAFLMRPQQGPVH